MKKLFLLLVLVSVASAQDSLQNLNEMLRRTSKRVSARFHIDSIEDASNHYFWQPESFTYNDSVSGAEIWKLTSTPGKHSVIYDIGLSPWNANGSKVAYYSDQITKKFTYPIDGTANWPWYIQSTTGGKKRPFNGSFRINTRSKIFGWNPQIPNKIINHKYQVVGDADRYKIYENIDNDTATSYSLVFTLDTTGGSDIYLSKGISYDGRSYFFLSLLTKTGKTLNVWPTYSVDDSDGWAVDRGYEQYGQMPASGIDRYHDLYPYATGKWLWVMPTSGAGEAYWWRIFTSGSAADGGCNCTHNDYPVTTGMLPYDFGECWPENTKIGAGPDDPFLLAYPSHFTVDPWGRFVLSHAYTDTGISYSGITVFDYQQHKIQRYCYTSNGGHHAWNGWSDICVSAPSGITGKPIVKITPFADTSINRYRYDTTGNTICKTYNIRDGSGVFYESETRPGLSPDGTKASYHTEFLNGSEGVDLYWVQIEQVRPPTGIVADSVTDDSLRIRFLPPRYTDRKWPFYKTDYDTVTFGWPHTDANGVEDSGKVCYAREIRRYHVWVSSNGTDWDIAKTDSALYLSTYKENSSWLFYHPVSHDSLEINEDNKIKTFVPKVAGTRYYMITAEEHSGLESDSSSLVLSVTISDGSISDTSSSGAVVDYWNDNPEPPTNFTMLAGDTSTSRILTWDEPDNDKIRYYNIYYSVTDTPEDVIQNRIASLPVGTTKFYDWLADDGDVYYKITSVDRYDNESQSDSTQYISSSILDTVISSTLQSGRDTTRWIIKSSSEWGISKSHWLIGLNDTMATDTVWYDSGIGVSANALCTLSVTSPYRRYIKNLVSTGNVRP